MPLQSSGAISLNDIHVEAGGSSGSQASINDADIRALIGKSSGATMSFNEWYGASANAFPGSGEDSWFQTGGLGGDAPQGSGSGAWGQASVSSTFFAQAGCNLGFQNDQPNDRIAMRWSTFTSAAASSFSFAYVGYDGFATNTFYAKCVYAVNSSGFVGSVENPASYSPATNTYAAVSTSSYSPLWQWKATVNSPDSGTRSLSSFSGTNPDWTVATDSSGTNPISGPARVVSLQATRGTQGGGGGFGGDICVHEDMLVSTQRGNMTIDDIVDKAPPKIWSWNKDTNQKELCNLLEVKIVEHDNLYKINNIMITEDHPVYLEGYVAASVDPAKSKDNYDIDCAQLAVGNKLMKEDGTLEEITSMAAYSGTHRTYTLKTTLSNFYADGVLVDSEI